MSESLSLPAASTPLPQPPAPVRSKLVAVCRGRAMMLTMPAANVMHVPQTFGHTRLHALAESELLDAGLAALRALWSLPSPTPAIYAARRDLATMEAAQDWLDGQAGVIHEHCLRAGFPDAEDAATVALGLLRRVSAHFHGHLRQAGGIKAWAREMRGIIRASRELAKWLEGPAGTATRDAMPQGLEEILPELLQTPAAHHHGRSLGELLPGLLARFAVGLEAQLAAAPRPTGRPATAEALIFGAEGLLAAWLAHHPRPPTLRAKVDGFVGWAETLLRLAVEANDARDGMGKAGSAMLARGTLKRELTTAVQAHRAGPQEWPVTPEVLRPGWNPARASDDCVWSDVSEVARGMSGQEPPTLRDLARSR